MKSSVIVPEGIEPSRLTCVGYAVWSCALSATMTAGHGSRLVTGFSADAAAQAALLEQSLRSAGTPERAASEKAYLKSDLEFAAHGRLPGQAAGHPQALTAARALASAAGGRPARRTLSLVRWG